MATRLQHSSNNLLFVSNRKHKRFVTTWGVIHMNCLFKKSVGAPVSHAIIPLSVHGVWRRRRDACTWRWALQSQLALCHIWHWRPSEVPGWCRSVKQRQARGSARHFLMQSAIPCKLPVVWAPVSLSIKCRTWRCMWDSPLRSGCQRWCTVRDELQGWTSTRSVRTGIQWAPGNCLRLGWVPVVLVV